MDDDLTMVPGANTPAAKAALEAKKPPPQPWERPAGAANVAKPSTVTACDLMGKTFPAPKWVLDGVFPTGLTVIAGKPKQGKSWLALQIAWAVACGMPIDGRATWPGEVLYLALEDTERRLQGRLKMLSNELKAENGWIIPETLHLATAWPRMGYTAQEMGLVFVNEWLAERKDTARLVIIDTMAMFRKQPKGHSNAYAEDYDAASSLKRCVDMYDSSAFYIHHTRKLRSEDPFDEISGSNGIAGAADTLAVLENEPRRQKLYVKGRDVAESTIDLTFTKSSGRWVLGHAKEGIETEGRITVGEGAKSTVESCMDWLRTFLAKEAYPSEEITWAAEAAGFSFDSLKRAKVRLGKSGTNEVIHRNLSQTAAAEWWSGIGPPIDWNRRKVPILDPKRKKSESSESSESTHDIPE